MRHRDSSRCLLAIALTAGLLAFDVGAQSYPARPVRLVIPFSPGGAADVPARVVMQRFSEMLGQQVVIENRPGAGSTIGADFAAKANPDGYTLFLISNTHFVSAALYKHLPYNSLSDFTPVTQITSAPNVIVVHPSLPVKSVQDLIVLARARPRQIDYASSGNGSTQHLTGALFARMAGIEMTHIPYRGSGPVTADLLGGQVQIAFPGIAGMLPHIRAGKLRALAVTGTKRSPELPVVPTVAEAGVKGYVMVAWFGVAGPRALPRDIQAKLHSDLVRVVRAPQMQKSLMAMGQEPAWQDTPEHFLEFMKAESAKWDKAVKDSGAKLQ